MHIGVSLDMAQAPQPSAVAGPSAIFSSLGFVADAAAGATVNGSNRLTALADQSGNGHNFAGAGGSPLYSASGGPNGAPYFSTDGTTYLKNTTYDAAATGTTPLLLCLVAKIDTWAALKLLLFVGQASTTFIEIFTNGSASKITCDGGNAFVETGGAWKRIYLQLDATLGNCFLKAGTSSSTLNANNSVNPAAGVAIGASDTGTIGIVGSFAYVLATPTLASPAQLTKLDTYLSSRFGAAVLT